MTEGDTDQQDLDQSAEDDHDDGDDQHVAGGDGRFDP